MDHPSSSHHADDAAPRVSLIAAVTRNGVIGRDGDLVWRIPADLAHFKRVTMGHPIVMGRRTWESIGRPLPGRRNLVVTRNAGYLAPGAETADSLATALRLCADSPEVFVVGGAEIYRQALPLAERLWLTEIHADAEGDARFPDWDPARFLLASREAHPAAGGLPAYDFALYERRH